MYKSTLQPNTSHQESMININLLQEQPKNRFERGMQHKNILRRQINDTRPVDNTGRRISGFPSAISPFDTRHTTGCNNQVQGVPHEEVENSYIFMSGMKQYEVQNSSKTDTHPLIHNNGKPRIINGVLLNKSGNNNSDHTSSLESNVFNQENDHEGDPSPSNNPNNP